MEDWRHGSGAGEAEVWSRALSESLRSAPLFAQGLPEAAVWDRRALPVSGNRRCFDFEQKLGHLYEDVLEDLLRASDQLVASHVQVFDTDGKTLGEIDFLLFDTERKCHVHLELAVKFYLAYQGKGGWQFPGPNARDSWQRKLARLRQHQLRLAGLPTTRDLLRKRFGVDHLEVRQLVYGRLFAPMTESDPPLPDSVSPGVLRGRWLYRQQWTDFFAEDPELRLVPKPLWPLEWTTERIERLPRITTDELQERAGDRCTMFMAGESRHPFFIVPDGWPGSEKARAG